MKFEELNAGDEFRLKKVDTEYPDIIQYIYRKISPIVSAEGIRFVACRDDGCLIGLNDIDYDDEVCNISRHIDICKYGNQANMI